MNNFQSVEHFFNNKNIVFISASGGKELRIICPFCNNIKQKCYVHSNNGCFYCFHCGQGGSWKGLVEKLGEPNAIIPESEIEEDNEPDLPPIDLQDVEECHQRLFSDMCKPIIDYLQNKRGYTEETIKQFKLGWDGRNIVIPVFDANGDCVNFRLRPDPTHPNRKKITFSIAGRGRKRLFNEAILANKQESIIICEGEWDCMLLTQCGYSAITSTAGALSFDQAWVDSFKNTGKVFICYDNDRNGAGQKGATKTAQMFYEKGITTYIVELPSPQGIEEKIDITDFFIKNGAEAKEAFNKLLLVANEYQQVQEKEREQRYNPKLIDLILEEVKNGTLLLFHDQYKDGYIALKGNGKEVVKFRSKQCKLWLSQFSWNKTGKIPSRDTLQNTIQTLEGKAIFENELYNLDVRIAEYDNALWYDLADGNVVRITKEGWAINDKPPILFQRFKHQLAQVYPLAGGDIHAIREFLNIHSEEEYLLFLITLISYFIPNFPHPLLLLYGSQGAGKTTPLRLVKLLVDPSILKTLTSPDNLREFVQMASHHYFFFLDNISSIRSWLSDALARAVTGDGFPKRELYSDDEDVIYSFQRSIGLNGINQVVQKADLLDRSILLGLERIAKDKRKTEKEFWAAVEKQKPYILGAIFDAVAGALREHPNIHLTEMPRMADFTVWGCAIAKAMGYSQKDFLTAYYNNINQQNDEAIEANPIGDAIIHFMENKESWEGRASDLLIELVKIAETLKIDVRSNEWPKDASALSKKIQLINANLFEIGIVVVRSEKARPRKITIRKLHKNADGSDGSSETSQNEASHNPTAFTDNMIFADNNADGNSESKINGTTASTTPTAFSHDLAETTVQELRDLKNTYATFFPLKELSEYTDEDLITYLKTIADYDLINDNQPNGNKYTLLANAYREEIKRRGIKTEVEANVDN